MYPTVTLSVTQGDLEGKGFTLEQRGRYVIGRADDCDIQLEGGSGLAALSRHQCVLAFDPPQLRVRDLGSRNGTFVNDELIGRRTAADPLDGAELDDFPEFELRDGDELRVGNIVFQVRVGEPSAAPQPFLYFPVHLA